MIRCQLTCRVVPVGRLIDADNVGFVFKTTDGVDAVKSTESVDKLNGRSVDIVGVVESCEGIFPEIDTDRSVLRLVEIVGINKLAAGEIDIDGVARLVASDSGYDGRPVNNVVSLGKSSVGSEADNVKLGGPLGIPLKDGISAEVLKIPVVNTVTVNGGGTKVTVTEPSQTTQKSVFTHDFGKLAEGSYPVKGPTGRSLRSEKRWQRKPTDAIA